MVCSSCLNGCWGSHSYLQIETNWGQECFLYIFLIVAIVFSGIPYFLNISHSMSRFTESNAFTISRNRTNKSWLAAQRFWRVIFKVAVASEHPRPFIKPACSWRPFFQDGHSFVTPWLSLGFLKEHREGILDGNSSVEIGPPFLGGV